MSISLPVCLFPSRCVYFPPGVSISLPVCLFPSRCVYFSPRTPFIAHSTPPGELNAQTPKMSISLASRRLKRSSSTLRHLLRCLYVS